MPDGSVQEIHKLVVYEFKLSDVEDPDLYAAQPLHEWKQSAAGKFVLENAIETPNFYKNLDPNIFGYRFVIVAELEKKKLAEFYLRFKNGNC